MIYSPIQESKQKLKFPFVPILYFIKHLDIHPKKDVHLGRSFSAMSISPITEFST